MLCRFEQMGDRLQQRQHELLWRQRHCVEGAQQPHLNLGGERLLSFCSNDYLGLANDPAVVEAFQAGAAQFGVGSGASHLVCGHHQQHQQLEQALARHTGREAALLFGSGYQANLAVISTLMQRGDTVLQDKLNHASLLDGSRLSQARFLRYRHGDVAHLEQQLESAQGKVLVVTDAVFSMDGDIAPLSTLAPLCEQHKAWLMVDDAHGYGVLGPGGAGSLAQVGLSQDQVPILVGTLGKALGTGGAFVAGSQTLIDYLVQFARPYIYTTAMPPALASATLAALALVRDDNSRRESLVERIRQFKAGMASVDIELMPSDTAIQPLWMGDNEKALSASARLRQKGMLVTAIRPPTVPAGSARLRVTLSAAHTQADVDQLLEALSVQ